MTGRFTHLTLTGNVFEQLIFSETGQDENQSSMLPPATVKQVFTVKHTAMFM
jgi:hypothetical protein